MEEDVLSWLLEEENPSARYLVMKNLLDMKEKDSEVDEARKNIREMKHIKKLFEKQDKKGFWGKENCPYRPKYKSTYWTLMLLAQLGLERDQRIEDACECIFGFQKEHGGFVSSWGDGIATPCLTGNVAIFLHHFGYRDSRTQKAVEYLCKTQLPDGGWVCHEWKSHARDNHGCFQGTITPLEALMFFGKDKEVVRGAEFFLMHRLFLADHHDFSIIKPHFLLLRFPTFFYSIMRGLSVLTGLGYKDERMSDALHILTSKRKENGRWICEAVPNLLSTFDRKGCESKWVTLQALTVLKRFGEGERKGGRC